RHIYCHYLSKISPFLTLGKPLYLVVTLGLSNTQPLQNLYIFCSYLTKTSPLENFDTLPKPYRSMVLKK
ncbi:hypothetical protein RKZ11_11715, partial [Streptococcus pneumoniae]|nr:hypothetical protein [Streptococcus pneumoniae]